MPRNAKECQGGVRYEFDMWLVSDFSAKPSAPKKKNRAEGCRDTEALKGTTRESLGKRKNHQKKVHKFSFINIKSINNSPSSSNFTVGLCLTLGNMSYILF